MNMSWILSLTCIFICCAFAGDSYQESKPGNEKRKSVVSRSYRVIKHRSELSHSRTKRKSPIIIRIWEALWRKLNNLKPLFSDNKEHCISKEVKGNALASKGKSCRPEKQWPQKMCFMTSQYEISGKNHICSVKTFSFRGIIYPPETKFIGTSGILAWGKSRVLPTDFVFTLEWFFFHLVFITYLFEK